jgi:RNA polymerase sigma-70 factor, ECF subfamily
MGFPGQAEAVALAEFMKEARARWPRAQWDVAALEGHYQALQGQGADPLHEERLLALACLHKDPDAWQLLEHRYIQDIVPNLKAMGLGPDERDEVLQRLRGRLQGIGTGAPRLALYSGRGHLGGFIRALAVRLAMDLRREPRLDEEVLKLFDQEVGDPEILYLKAHYAARFAEAVRAALTRLKPGQRLFLVHQLVDRLSIDALAELYHIHRATAARRCAAARDALARCTRRELRILLGVGAQTLESIARLLSSRIEELVEKNIDPAPES